MMMVSLDSARQWYPREEFVACNADHSQIAKLKRGENSIYPSVRWAIKKALLSAGDLYIEAKSPYPDKSRTLGRADEASRLRRTLLQATHHQSAEPSNDHMANPAPIPSRSLSENAIDQDIRRQRQVNIDISASGGDTQSKTDSLDETVSRWQSGMDISKRDDIQSFASPKKSVETDMASVLFDEDSAASKSTGLATSFGAEPNVSKVTEAATDSDPPKIELNVSELMSPQNDDPDVPKNAAKSIIMDEVMKSAIRGGEEENTRDLLAHSYDVNCKDDEEMTPLLLAANYRQENIVKLLLEQEPNLSARNNKGRTKLHLLARRTEIPLSESLIDLLLKDRPPLDVVTTIGTTPLMVACKFGEKLLATKLIRHGANVHARDNNGWTPLHCAASNGKAQMIPLLVANGAEVEAKIPRYGDTPLHFAAWSQSDSSDTVEQLLLAGADIEAKTLYKCTPLRLAIGDGQKACVARLLESGANPDVKNPNNEAALHIAVRQGQLEIVKALLDHGANPTVKMGLLRTKPSSVTVENNDVSFTQKKEIKALLREAEKAWKQSGKS